MESVPECAADALFWSSRASEAVLVLTSRCNLRCISCAQPRSSYSHPDVRDEAVLDALEAAPSHLKHVTISGGEPTLRPKLLIEVLDRLQRDRSGVSVQLLTNGVVLRDGCLCDRICAAAPSDFTVAVPLYGGSPEQHDGVTQVEGSLASTRKGLNNLLSRGLAVDVRVLLTRSVAGSLTRLVSLVRGEMAAVQRVVLMCPEVHGVARDNMEAVWSPLAEQVRRAIGPLATLIEAGVPVSLFNFPLCVVPTYLWSLCEDSISPWKKTYFARCDGCRVRGTCPGAFAASAPLIEKEIRPIVR